MKKLLLCLLLTLTLSNAFSRSTKGKEFWIGFMENLSLAFNGDPSFKLHLVSEVSTTCTLTIPYTGYTRVISLTANKVFAFPLPSAHYHPFGDEAFASNGILLRSQDDIEVKAFHHRLNFTESSIILPVHELGTHYQVLTVTDENNLNPGEFVVLATQDNTVIEIIPSVETIGVRPAGVAFTVSLQKGQMFQIQSFKDLSGTLITSLDPQKKIAVYAGAKQAYIGCKSAADSHVYDQIYPVSSLGTRYHVVPFHGQTFDVVKIMAAENNTDVWVHGGSSFYLQKGQTVSLGISSPMVINSSKPISVTQIATSIFCNGSGVGDPGMIILPPYDLTSKKSVFYTLPSHRMPATSEYWPVHHVNVVVKNSAIGSLKVDQNIVPTNSFSPMGAGVDYSYVKLHFDTLGTLQHTLTCDSGFSAITYALIQYTMFGHHLGYDRPQYNAQVGLKENHRAASIGVFPNPATTELNIRTDHPVSFIEIKDVFGHVVLTASGNDEKDLKLKLDRLDAGMYFCNITFTDPNVTSNAIRFIKTSKE